MTKAEQLIEQVASSLCEYKEIIGKVDHTPSARSVLARVKKALRMINLDYEVDVVSIESVQHSAMARQTTYHPADIVTIDLKNPVAYDYESKLQKALGRAGGLVVTNNEFELKVLPDWYA